MKKERDNNQKSETNQELTNEIYRGFLENETKKIFENQFKEKLKFYTIFAVVVSILLAFLTFLGYKDLKEFASNRILNEIKKELQIDNPKSALKEELNSIVAKAVVNSLLIKMERDPNPFLSKFYLDLDQRTVNRILEFLSNENTPLNDFTDSIIVLNSIPAEDELLKEMISNRLNELLFPKNENKKWILSQEKKRIEIMKNFYNRTLASTVRSRLLADEESIEFKMGALQYLAKINDAVLINEIENLAKNSTNKPLKLSAILYLAKVKPDCAYLDRIVQKLKNGETGEFDYIDGIKIVSVLIGRINTGFQITNFNSNVYNKYIIELLRTSLNQNIKFEFHNLIGRPYDYYLYVGIGGGRTEYLMFNRTDLLFISGKDYFSSLLKEAANERSLKQLAEYIKILTIKEIGDKAVTNVKVNLLNNASLTLKNNLVLNRSNTPFGLVFLNNELKKPYIEVIWFDEIGNRRRGELISIENAKDLDFEIIYKKPIYDYFSNLLY